MSKVKTDETDAERDERLLYTRKQVAALLGVNTSYVQGLERAGRLKGLRLSRSSTSMVFFRKCDVLRLVEEASHD